MSQDRCPPHEVLRRLLNGEVEEAEAGPLECHFSGCPDCVRAAAALEAEEGPRPSLQTAWPGGEAVERLMALLGRLSAARGADDTLAGGPTQETSLPSVPGYEVLAILGHGGMGVVYKARQVQLNRLVALKMIRRERAAPEQLSRFRIEAESVARLRHPNIVQVYEVGLAGGGPFLSLEYCAGGSLAERLREELPRPAAAVALLDVLARAVHAAHLEHVIHRDLKPANVLLAACGFTESALAKPQAAEWTPKIADFGLAKRLDVPDGHTQTGELMGTPGYMAPEQAEGKLDQIGPATDVYALGAILYEMLTGRPPFKGTSLRGTLDLVCHAEPVPPRRLQPGVPRDAQTICLKCLHKEPHRRYASAAELAEDCAAFGRGEPIRARPVGSGERLLKWVRRRPGMAALSAAVVLAAGLLMAGGVWFSIAMARARGALEAEEARSETRARLAEANEFFGLVRGVEKRSARPEVGWTWANLADLERAARMAPAADHVLELRAEAVAALGGIDVREARSIVPEALGQPIEIQSVAFHPHGRYLAVGAARAYGYALCSVVLLDPAGKEKPRVLTFGTSAFGLAVLKSTQEGVSSLAFSPDGRRLVAGTSYGTLQCWDLAGEKPARVSRAAHEDRVSWLAFSADGKALFSGGQDRVVKRWSFPGLKEEARAEVPGPVRGLAVHPTEGWVLCAADRGEVHLAAHTLHPLCPSSTLVCPRACFSPDGRWVLYHVRQSVEVLDTRGVQMIQKLVAGQERSHERDVCSLALSPDGELILSASEGKQVRLWERSSGRLLADLPAEGENPQARFHPDGRSLVVAAGKQVRFYEIGGLREQTFAASRPYPLAACALGPDGGHLACLSQASPLGNGEVTVWPARPSPAPAPAASWPLAGSTGDDYLSLALAPHSLTAGCTLPVPDALVLLGPPGQRTAGPGGPALAFAPDGQLWAASGGEVQRREVPGGRVSASWSSGGVRVLTGASDPIALAAGRRWVAAGAKNGFVYLLHAATASAAGTFHVAEGPVRSVALNPGESLAAAGTDRGELRLLALPGGDVVAKDRPHRDRVTALSFAGDTLLASGSRDRTVRLWQCGGGALRELMTLPMPGPVRWLAFHPEGARLFVLLDGERVVRVWHLDRLRERLIALRLGGGLEAIEAHALPPAAALPPPAPPVTESPEGPNGLRAELFTDTELRHPVKVRFDPQISVLWPTFGIDPVLPKDGYSVRWTGWLKAPRPGRYFLEVDSAGPAGAWLDDRLIIRGTQQRGWHQEVAVDLTGRPQRLRLEHVNLQEATAFRLSWRQEGGFRHHIPPWALFHDRAEAERAVVPPPARVELKPVRPFAVPGVLRAVLTPDGRHLVAGGTDGALRVVELAGGKEAQCLRRDWAKDPPHPSLPPDRARRISALAVSHNGKRVLAGEEGGALTLWDLTSGKEVRVFRGHTAVARVAFSPDDSRAASAGALGDRSVRIWNVARGTEVRRLEGGTGQTGTNGLAWLPDGKRLLVWSSDPAALRLWDAATGKRVEGQEWPAETKGRLAALADGSRLAVKGGDSGVLWVADHKRGTFVRRWEVPLDPGARGLALCPDGRLVAAVRGRSVLLFDADAGALVGQADDPTAKELRDVVFSADGRFLLTLPGDAGAPLRLWELTEKKVAGK
jgi:WD40 repeat protein